MKTHTILFLCILFLIPILFLTSCYDEMSLEDELNFKNSNQNEIVENASIQSDLGIISIDQSEGSETQLKATSAIAQTDPLLFAGVSQFFSGAWYRSNPSFDTNLEANSFAAENPAFIYKYTTESGLEGCLKFESPTIQLYFDPLGGPDFYIVRYTTNDTPLVGFESSDGHYIKLDPPMVVGACACGTSSDPEVLFYAEKLAPYVPEIESSLILPLNGGTDLRYCF